MRLQEFPGAQFPAEIMGMRRKEGGGGGANNTGNEGPLVPRKESASLAFHDSQYPLQGSS